VKSPKDQADRQSQNQLPLHSVIKPTTNQNDDFFDSIGQKQTRAPQHEQCKKKDRQRGGPSETRQVF
jgi:hypothetical protein